MLGQTLSLICHMVLSSRIDCAMPFLSSAHMCSISSKLAELITAFAGMADMQSPALLLFCM